MKKQILFTLVACLLSVSLTAADVSVTEKFSKVGNVATGTYTWTGDLCTWEISQTARRKQDTISTANQKQAIWMSVSANGAAKITTKDWEGGIKAVAFKFARFGSEKTAGRVLQLEVTAGEMKDSTLTYANNAMKQGTNGVNSAHETYSYAFNNKQGNAQLSIQNISTYTEALSASGICRICVGDITITPYLLYTTKEVVWDLREGATTYTNTGLINNTDAGAVVYSISENTIGATIDAATGAVTATKAGEVTVTATWEGIATSYTLTILAKTETEASFAEAIKRVDVKDVVKNTLTKTDDYDGTIAYASTNTAVATIAADGVLTIVGVGQTTITATLSETTNYKAAAASYNLYVTDKNALVEEFSNVEEKGAAQHHNTVWYGDVLDWRVQNAVRKNGDVFPSDNSRSGIWFGIPDPSTNYGILQSENPVEGGIKYLSFYWEQWGYESEHILKVAVYSNVEGTETLLTSMEYTPSGAAIPANRMLLGVNDVMRSNGQLLIKNESQKSDGTRVAGKGRLIIDNIHITPYLLYTEKAHSVRVGQKFKHELDINNTEGAITYSLEDNTNEAIINAVTGEVTAKAEGQVTVKATYGEAYTTYTLTIIPANCETFDAIKQTANYANTEVLMGDMCEWTTSLGGFNVGEFAAYTTNLVRFRAPHQGSDEQAYIQSGVLSNGIKKLRFNWNVGGSETTTNWDIRILINGIEVKRCTTDLATKAMPEFGTIEIDNINEPGNFTIRFENHSTIEGEYTSTSTSTNKARFLIDNIVWENYDVATKILDEKADNSGWLVNNNGETSDIQLVRSNLVANVYNTLCLPFAISKSTDLAGADVQEMISADLEGNVLTIGFTPLAGDELKAGVPYLVKPTTEVALNTFNGVQIVAAPQAVTQGIVTLQGIFSPTKMTAGDQTTLFVGTPDENGDNLYYPSATANIKGFRAYFKLNLPDGVNAAPARARFVVNQTEVATGVEQVATQAQTTKMLRDGQLIIMRDGVEYNAQGARVK